MNLGVFLRLNKTFIVSTASDKGQLAISLFNMNNCRPRQLSPMIQSRGHLLTLPLAFTSFRLVENDSINSVEPEILTSVVNFGKV